MKYIKTFEYDDNKMYIDDYVLLDISNLAITSDKEQQQQFVEFINNTIGQIVESFSRNIIVKYENIPFHLRHLFAYEDKIYSIYISKDNVVLYDMKKENLKLKIEARKYNL